MESTVQTAYYKILKAVSYANLMLEQLTAAQTFAWTECVHRQVGGKAKPSPEMYVGESERARRGV